MNALSNWVLVSVMLIGNVASNAQSDDKNSSPTSQGQRNAGHGENQTPPAPKGGVFRVGGGVSAPKVTYAPDPEYSEEARKGKIEGVVVLWMIVTPEGTVRDVKVARSLGHGLDEKAIEAVKKWKFEPALKDGQPVAVQINVKCSFRLSK